MPLNDKFRFASSSSLRKSHLPFLLPSTVVGEHGDWMALRADAGYSKYSPVVKWHSTLGSAVGANPRRPGW